MSSAAQWVQVVRSMSLGLDGGTTDVVFIGNNAYVLETLVSSVLRVASSRRVRNAATLRRTSARSNYYRTS
jgi:hypothetical protein